MAVRKWSAFAPEKWHLTLIMVSSKWIAGSLQPLMHPTGDLVWSARTAKSKEHPCSRLWSLA